MSDIQIPDNICLKHLKAFRSQTKAELLRVLNRLQDLNDDKELAHTYACLKIAISLDVIRRKHYKRQLRGRPVKHMEHYQKVLQYLSQE